MACPIAALLFVFIWVRVESNHRFVWAGSQQRSYQPGVRGICTTTHVPESAVWWEQNTNGAKPSVNTQLLHKTHSTRGFCQIFRSHRRRCSHKTPEETDAEDSGYARSVLIPLIISPIWFGFIQSFKRLAKKMYPLYPLSNRLTIEFFLHFATLIKILKCLPSNKSDLCEETGTVDCEPLSRVPMGVLSWKATRRRMHRRQENR